MPTNDLATVDRLIVHQFDPARPSPGGIDTCLRGICSYLPAGKSIAVVGVDAGHPVPGRRLGKWEQHTLRDQTIHFLPVVSLDPADQSRRVPHSLRLIAGLLRHARSLPKSRIVQAHRMDTAAALRIITRRPQAYFIHTQAGGLTGSTSDSFWKFASRAHRALERHVVRRASAVVVFNEDYAKEVRLWNSEAVFSPTWYDPALISTNDDLHDSHAILWVGRLELPKDPELAIDAFCELVRRAPDKPWTLKMLGSGTLLEAMQKKIDSLDEDLQSRIELAGRVSPPDVARLMSQSGLFLMTSHAGYEGYPRVLVEAMASGLPAVVTHGADTGGLVADGITGFVCDRSPAQLALRLEESVAFDRTVARASVSDFDAPNIVERVLSLPDEEAGS